MSSLRRRAPLALAAIFTTSGLVHLVRPQVFEAIMPRAIPQRHHRSLIFWSGLAELACALGLVRRHRWAPAASTVVLAAVFPANVQMALDAGSGRHQGPAGSRAVAWGRLPLQPLLAWAAWQGRPEPDGGQVPR